MHGGKREGSGRKPKQVMTIPEGADPAAFLSEIMGGKVGDEDISLAMRLDAAKALCPYLYPRLSSIQASLDPIELIHRIERAIVDPKDTDS